ncbi:hypothetical protein [Agrococcus sp. Marseille-P2731]|uniref:hypothetical protein n=1 Tax=Agrococcus sp. Marseille-P2731 TaxID=1841862 RepID=UPI0009302751|nr:hypothetical protein [Agrococcus sp. Marseille-P2731]
MEMFALLFTIAEVALVALGIAAMTVVAIGGVVVGSASLVQLRGSHRASSAPRTAPAARRQPAAASATA